MDRSVPILVCGYFQRQYGSAVPCAGYLRLCRNAALLGDMLENTRALFFDGHKIKEIEIVLMCVALAECNII